MTDDAWRWNFIAVAKNETPQNHSEADSPKPYVGSPQEAGVRTGSNCNPDAHATTGERRVTIKLKC